MEGQGPNYFGQSFWFRACSIRLGIKCINVHNKSCSHKMKVDNLHVHCRYWVITLNIDMHLACGWGDILYLQCNMYVSHVAKKYKINDYETATVLFQVRNALCKIATRGMKRCSSPAAHCSTQALLVWQWPWPLPVCYKLRVSPSTVCLTLPLLIMWWN